MENRDATVCVFMCMFFYNAANQKKSFAMKCLSTYSCLYFNCRLSVRYICNLKIDSIVSREALLCYVVLLVQICAIVQSISINQEG